MAISAPSSSGSSGRSSEYDSSACARLTWSTTAICEWSDMTITACESRNSSGPPAGCMIRSSARWADGPGGGGENPRDRAVGRRDRGDLGVRPAFVRVGVVVGERGEHEVEEVVLDE